MSNTNPFEAAVAAYQAWDVSIDAALNNWGEDTHEAEQAAYGAWETAFTRLCYTRGIDRAIKALRLTEQRLWDQVAEHAAAVTA